MDNAALRARYDGYDLNGDGQLEFSEFSELLAELGAGYDEAQVRSAFESLDADHNAQIDFDEFAAWWVGQ
jgi:Ca2+-binding EF-hand superfamily protein